MTIYNVQLMTTIKRGN